MTIWYAGVVTLLGTIAIVLVTTWLIFSAKTVEPAESATAQLYRVRYRYFLGLTLVLITFLVATFSTLPYRIGASAAPEYVVPVTGRLWLWEMGPLQDRDGNPAQAAGSALVVPLGEPVEFRVTATDVNHSFGIYNGAGELLAQTQAMPGYANRLVHTFTESGTYRVLCMEFCGLAHHVMATTITVQ